MKKNIITAGMLAAGVASLYAENVTGLTEAQAAKPWTVSGVVRGFYDSNPQISTYGQREESWGVYLSPSVGFNYPLENSLLSLTATYGAWWYENRDSDNWDQSVEVNGRFNHKFDEHTLLNIEDNFLYTDQPAITETGVAQTVLNRSDNSYLRNRFPVDFVTKFNERFGINVGYQNTYWNFQDDVYSAQLDRVEQLAHADLHYYLQPDLILLGGYQFGWNTFLSDDVIFDPDGSFPFPTGDEIKGEDRSNVAHYFYGGAQATLSPLLKAVLKIGAAYTDWYELDQSDWSPYVDGSVSYNYLPGSYLRGGLLIMKNATDVVAADSNNNVTLAQQSYIPYVALTHAVTPKLTANVLGQLQVSQYDDGFYDNADADYYWTFGVNVKYTFNKNLFTEAGYNYDGLVSDVSGRPFNRNRVYLGIGATY